MRVLHVVPSLDPATGGPARSVPALCRALQAEGVTVSLYTFRPADAPVTVSSGETFPITYFKPFSTSRQLPSVNFYRRLRRDVLQYDLVHLHSLWNPAISLAALCCRRASVPYVLSPRGMLQSGAVRRKARLKSAYYRLWERDTVGHASALHFFTESEAAESEPFMSPNASFTVVRNGVDPDALKDVAAGQFRKAYPSLQGKRIALFLGRLHWSKGLGLQADALALLVREFPDLVWVLVGPDEGEWAHLSEQIARLGLTQHVLWTGPLSQSRCLEALKDADVFLLTSRHEAHSVAMNEALITGVPICLTDTVRFDEIEAYGAGRVVTADAKALANAVAEILNDPARAASMRLAGRRLATEHLAWPKVARAMIEVYEKILAADDQRDEEPALCRIEAGNL
ncbi:MAG TPA: glycosyltransferase [Pyrinomonadaceae bacterium]|nr:glycosyltransferase [Pyrinomonadaceae bacterium]